MKILYLYFFLFSFLTHSLFSQDFQIDRYEVDIQLFNEPYFDVTEIISVNFPEQRRGIFRDIPIRHRVDGQSVKVDITNIEVIGHPYKVLEKSNNVTIRIGDPDIYVKDGQVYEIKYRVHEAFIWSDDQVDFYWNLVGTEWPVSIERIDFSIQYPATIDKTIQDFGVADGTFGTNRESVNIHRANLEISGYTTKELAPGEGVTIGIRMDAGVINQPVTPRDLTYPIPALVMLGLLVFWRKKGRNQHKSNSYSDQYYPPEGISASEAGALYDTRVNNRDVIALIPDWGRRGIIKVRSMEEEYGFESDDLFLEKMRDLPEESPEYEFILFNGLFKKTDLISLASLQHSFSPTISQAVKALNEHIKSESFYDKESYRIFHSGWFISLFLVGVISGILIMIFTGFIITGILTIIAGIVCLVIHFLPPKKTREGLAMQHYIKGFRQFLQKASGNDLEPLTQRDAQYFEKCLPFAVVFGLDKTFIRAFEELDNMSPPAWFYSQHHLQTGQPTSFEHFGRHFNVQEVATAFTAQAPHAGASSSGSTFSGSTGGGFGGGGGGSW